MYLAEAKGSVEAISILKQHGAKKIQFTAPQISGATMLELPRKEKEMDEADNAHGLRSITELEKNLKVPCRYTEY